jgi:hypothetical protein
MLETGVAHGRWLIRGAERQEATTMIEQGSMVLERDVSEVVAQVWIDYWHRLGWEVDGEPELAGVHHAGHRVLDFHLRAAHDGAVVPPVRAAYDLHSLAV